MKEDKEVEYTLYLIIYDDICAGLHPRIVYVKEAIDYFIKLEDYEKCIVLRDFINKKKKAIQ